MPNALEKVLDYIIAVILMFILPVCIFGILKDRVIQVGVDNATAKLSETVAVKGYISKSMYEKYLENLDHTGMLYDVELIHELYAFDPEYKLRSALEVTEEDESLWQGVNEYFPSEVTTEVPDIEDPIDNSGLTMNTETNESVLAEAVDTPASAGHIHTDACYGGHRHIPVYGSTEVAGNVKVYLKRGYKYFTGDNKYLQYIDIICDECNKVIHSIRYSDTGSYSHTTGYTVTYNYDSDGNPTEVRRNFDILPAPEAPGQGLKGAFANYVGSIAAWISNNEAVRYDGYSGYYYTSYRTDYPFGGLPVWDAVGNRSELPFPGCTYEEGHKDPSACCPLGDITKRVNVSYSCHVTPNSRFYSVEVTCTACGNLLFYIGGSSYLGGSAGGAGYSTSFTFRKYAYTPTGAIETEYHNFTSSNADSGAYAARDIYDLYYNYCKSLPNQRIVNNSGGDDIYNFEAEANNVDWTLDQLPYIQGFERVPEGYIIGNSIWSGCPYHNTFGTYYSCGQTSTLICDKKTTGIVPTHPVQSVYTGEALITTVTATHLDGSTSTVPAGTAFSTETPGTGQTATLTYTDATGNTLTCTITVNVVPRNKTCPYGHTYNLNNDGSDPGCPYCRGYLASLSVAVPSSGSMTMFRSSTGSLETEGVGLLAVYLDGHCEYVYSGYTDNLDPLYVGTQTVTIGYKGLLTTLEVTVLRNRKKCDVCGRYYNLYMDDTDPGCPYCRAKVPVFTGNVMSYRSAAYEDAIITELYEGAGSYYLRRGDRFTVKVNSREKSGGLIGRLFNLKIGAVASDRIKDEVIHD